MQNFDQIFTLIAEHEGIGLNTDILETGLLNILTLVGILIFTGRDFLGSYCVVSLLASANNCEALLRFVKMYSLRSSIIVNKGLYKIILSITISRINWIATNGKVALMSNNPPGPLTSELEINIERLIIQNLDTVL